MNLEDLEKTANNIRKDIIKILLAAGSGHSAGPLGSADIFTALYFEILNHNPKDPGWEDRDRFFLSCGHYAPALYCTLSRAGYFDEKELKTLRNLETRLQGHPERKKLHGLESTSGPLGEGLAQAAGYAYAARMKPSSHKDSERHMSHFRVFCLTSDGEHQEGNHWEAVMFAGAKKLSNLTSFVDRNNIQIDGHTEDIIPLEPLKEKYESFNWHVLEIDGHNIEEIIDAVGQARSVYEKPTVIICHTIPGKGVSFMENKFEWHGKPPNKEEAKKALGDLRTLEGKIKSEHE